MASLVSQIPRWVKQAARERGAFVAISVGDVVVLSIAPLEDAEPRVSRGFTPADYAASPEGCWSSVLAAFVAGQVP